MLAIREVVASSFLVCSPCLYEVRTDDGRADDEFIVKVLIEGINCESCWIGIPTVLVISDAMEWLSTFRKLVSIQGIRMDFFEYCCLVLNGLTKVNGGLTIIFEG